MLIQPDTTIYLIKNCPLDKTYQHTILFKDKNVQFNYFMNPENFTRKTYTKQSYQRYENGILTIQELADNLYEYNYLFFKNTAYGDKVFYAFITNVEYVNNVTSRVKYQIDVMQTWITDFTIQTCFVEREHCVDDSIGANLVPERLEYGEYISNKHTKTEFCSDLSIIVGITEYPDGTADTGVRYVTGIYTGIEYLAYNVSDTDANSETGYAALNRLIKSYDKSAKQKAIVTMFMCPTKFVNVIHETVGGVVYPIVSNLLYDGRYYINVNDKPAEQNKNIEFSSFTLDGYFPRNKKLYCYPYRYLLVSNNNGAECIYNYEQFYTIVDENYNKVLHLPRFTVESTITPGCSIRLTPLDYKGSDRNDIEGLNMGKFPIISWTSDVYTNWLRQNGLNVALDTVSGATNLAMGVATENIGGVVSGISSIARTLAQVYQASFVPNQAKGNINCGDVVTGFGQNDFHFYDYSIRKEFAEIIDGYFDMYGYATNKLKKPNLHTRAYWNYIKTANCRITGKLPSAENEKICTIFNNGITFWHDGNKIGDYSLAEYNIPIPVENGNIDN